MNTGVRDSLLIPTTAEGPLNATAPNVTSHDISALATRAAFLILFIVIGFVGNCVLVATVAQSNTQKGSVLNGFIFSMAFVNLLNCLAVMPFILGACITEQWDYGETICRLNAACMQLVSIVMLCTLVFMSLDRFIAILNHLKYKTRMTAGRARFMAGYAWMHGVAICVPLLTPAIPVSSDSVRYVCAQHHSGPLLYSALSAVFGFVLPILLIVVFFTFIACKAVRARTSWASANSNYTDSVVSESWVWLEINAAKYVGILVVLWCVLEGPHILVSYIAQFRTSAENMTGNEVLTYPWQVKLTLTWMKLSYPMILPVATLCWRKDVWHKFKNTILCQKSNMIIDAADKAKERYIQEKETGRDSGTDTLPKTPNGDVPVLYASENGLLTLQGQPGTPNANAGITMKELNGFGSQPNMEEGDTSDYDSTGEIDPFSSSNPISVRTEYGNRSVSVQLHDPPPEHPPRPSPRRSKETLVDEPRLSEATRAAPLSTADSVTDAPQDVTQVVNVASPKHEHQEDPQITSEAKTEAQKPAIKTRRKKKHSESESSIQKEPKESPRDNGQGHVNTAADLPEKPRNSPRDNASVAIVTRPPRKKDLAKQENFAGENSSVAQQPNDEVQQEVAVLEAISSEPPIEESPGLSSSANSNRSLLSSPAKKRKKKKKKQIPEDL